MEKESQRLLESVMKLIAAQFGPDCEVVLHDWSKEYESTIVAIENGHVSGRKVGDGGSNLGLEVMRGTTDGSNQLYYITQTQDGRMLRSSSLYLTDENGKKVGALCINLDVTDYIMMQHRLSGVTLFPCVRPGEQEVSREFFTNDVNELLDYLIKEGTEQIGKAPEEMTKEEKKQVISYLMLPQKQADMPVPRGQVVPGAGQGTQPAATPAAAPSTAPAAQPAAQNVPTMPPANSSHKLTPPTAPPPPPVGDEAAGAV